MEPLISTNSIDATNSINATTDAQDNGRVSRRGALGSIGSVSIGTALGLPWIARQLAYASEVDDTQPPRSLIVIWLRGGASQYETWDPHPDTEFGGPVKAIASSAEGVEISEFLPQTAEQMHQVALLRAVVSKEGDHRRALYNMQTGWRPDPTVTHPSLGALACYQWRDQLALDIPEHVSLLPENFAGRGGFLGSRFDAFKVEDPAKPIADLSARVGQTRFQRRMEGLQAIIETNFHRDRNHKAAQLRSQFAQATQTAHAMMSSQQLEAFDLKRESSATIAQFGDHAFGRSCLAAVRLIEVGVRCVEIGLSGWDTHVDNLQGQKTQCDILDPAYSSMLKLLAQRNLLGNTLVVCGSEFGRAPKVNALGGRDHWPHGFSMTLAGCGIRSAVVHGATSPTPTLDKEDLLSNLTDSVRVQDVHATILKALGIDHGQEIITPIGRPLKWSEGVPIEAVLM